MEERRGVAGWQRHRAERTPASPSLSNPASKRDRQGRSRAGPALGEALRNYQFDFLVSGIVIMLRRWLAEQ